MPKNPSSFSEAPAKPPVEASDDSVPAVESPRAASATRWKEIADAVQRGIEEGRLGVGDLLPSETALTKEWKVSRMTAHRAMQELQRSGLVTRQRGRGTLVAARNSKRTGNVALLFHSPLDRLEIEYLRGITTELGDEYQVIFCDSHVEVEREIRALNRMQKEADGIICIPTSAPAANPVFRKLVELGYPLVCVDRMPQGIALDAVVSDNLGATVSALQTLVARGHRCIAHFTRDEMSNSAVRERCEGFTQVMRESGEAQPERLIRVFPTASEKSFEGMVQLMHDALFTLLHQSEPPTAVFCVNDYCLMVLLAAMEQLGIRVPDDMEVVAFHDALTLLPSVCARLHRIVQEPRQMGRLAAQRLKLRLAHRDLPPEVIRVSASIHSFRADVSPGSPVRV